jgi:hypothetical protein
MSDYLIPTDIDQLLATCSWACDVATKDFNDFSEERNKRMTIHRKSEYYINTNLVEKQSSGDIKLKNLMSVLEFFDRAEGGKYKRSKHQIDFHKAFIGAILKKIYGPEIHSHLGKLLRDFELDELRPDVIVCTPRRYGKTTSVALFCAAVLWTLPGFKVDIYSTGRRASSKLLALIYKFLCLLGDPKQFRHTYNQETLAIFCPAGDISICNSYPSKVQINETERSKKEYHLAISTIFYTNFTRYAPCVAAFGVNRFRTCRHVGHSISKILNKK